jgi:hypothetical protein
VADETETQKFLDERADEIIRLLPADDGKLLRMWVRVSKARAQVSGRASAERSYAAGMLSITIGVLMMIGSVVAYYNLPTTRPEACPSCPPDPHAWETMVSDGRNNVTEKRLVVEDVTCWKVLRQDAWFIACR